jgi:uncharacterized protein (DUF2267 family)
MTTGDPMRDFIRQHELEVLREAYEGILGREPDPDGLAAHGATLRQTGRLASVLRDMVRSDEAWRSMLAARATDIVQAVFRALLGRDPEEEAQAAYAELLARTGDLEVFLTEVAHSQEHEARVLDRQGLGPGPAAPPGTGTFTSHEAVVTAVFQGMLGRPPDAEGLAAYTQLLADTGDLARFIAEVDRSAEHRRHVLLGRG